MNDADIRCKLLRDPGLSGARVEVSSPSVAPIDVILTGTALRMLEVRGVDVSHPEELVCRAAKASSDAIRRWVTTTARPIVAGQPRVVVEINSNSIVDLNAILVSLGKPLLDAP